MHIDWVTVAAQIVNFLVLIWLLRRFLYGPVTRAMKRREERIEARLSGASAAREEAGREAERLRRKQEEIEAQRKRILEEARALAHDLRETLEKEVRDEMEQRRREWRERVTAEREEFLHELRLRTARHIYDLAGSVLAEFAGAEVETQAALRFADRLQGLDGERAAKLAEAAHEAGNAVLVESSFGLPHEAKEKISRSVHDMISPDVEIRYGRSDDLLFGIRLMAGGQTVEWSLARYLERLETAVADKLAQAQTRKEREAA